MVTYALIPGGGGDPWEWHRLVPELEARGHDALAVRLPADDDTAGWSEYADAVIDAVGDRSDLILVAESMGGFTAPIVCTRRAVDLLVLLNAMIPVPGETFNAWWSNTDSGAARRAYHASIGLAPAEAEDDGVVYYHDLPAELREEAQARTWQDQSMRPLEEPWPLAAWPDTPTRVLAGRLDRMFPLDFQRRIARERLGLEVDEIDGGHMVALSHPGELADRLEAFRREAQPETLFEAVGGLDGLRRLASAWHERVMADEVVSHAFSHGFHPQHNERLAAYWAEALGGPTAYSDAYGDETSVVRLHSGNGVHEEMDRRAIACFDEALSDLGLARDDRLRQVLHDYFAWATTTSMARYHESADDVPDGLRIPRWSWDGLVD